MAMAADHPRLAFVGVVLAAEAVVEVIVGSVDAVGTGID